MTKSSPHHFALCTLYTIFALLTFKIIRHISSRHITIDKTHLTYNMERVNPFRGLGIALVTPFNEDGSIDFTSLEKLTNDQIENGIDFLCVLGTTAETPCLTAKEKRAVMDCVLKVNNNRVPLLLGAGGNCTANVVEYLKNEDLSGFEGVLIVAPFYNKPSQEGLYQHFVTVAKNSPLPVVLYNVPGRTGVNIEAATTLRIANECPNVVAIKEASGKIGQIEDIVENAPKGFEVLSGDDAITFELLTIGAKGVISVIGNAYPKEFGCMVHSAIQADYTTALKLHRSFSAAYKLLSADGNPAGIKSLLAVQKKAANILRLPIVPARKQTYEALEDFVCKFQG